MLVLLFFSSLFFFFNDTATTEIYTLSLHDALPISAGRGAMSVTEAAGLGASRVASRGSSRESLRSEEHTSELQSLAYLVCRLQLEKKKKKERKILRSASNSKCMVCAV